MCCYDEDIFEYIDRCATANASNGLRHSAAATSSKGKGKGGANTEMYTKAASKPARKGAGASGGGAGGERSSGGGKNEKQKVPGAADGEGVGKHTGGDQPGGVDGKVDDGTPSIITTFGTPITCTVGRKRSVGMYKLNAAGEPIA